jgi:hypothetical protein
VKRPTVEFLPATEALNKYLIAQPTGTMPRYHPFAWTSVPENVPFWDQIRQRKGYSGGLQKCVYLPIDSLHDYLMAVNGTNPEIAMRTPPWTDSFFYYDEECQLIFDIGKIAPVALFNYLNFEPDPELIDMKQMGGGMPGFYLEPHIPQPLIRQLVNNAFKIVIENPLKKVLPYGIFLWKKSFPGILEQLAQFQVPSQMICKLIPDQGVFLRFMLQPGNNGYILQK